MWSVAMWNEVQWMKQSEWEWGEVQYRKGGKESMEKVYRSSRWWEVKDWVETVSEWV